jgi:glycosyltransferase involved in cell wall biosynthesis
MRVLQICPKPPRPSIDGGCLAMDAITKGLLDAGCDVRVLVTSTHKHPAKLKEIDNDYLKKVGFKSFSIDTRVKPLSALKHLITGVSYNISRFESYELDAEIQKLISENDFDCIILESLFTGAYINTIRKFSKAKIILRAHNVEHQIWSGLANNTSHGIKKWYLTKLSKQLKAYEIKCLNEVDAIIPITKVDGNIFKRLGAVVPIHVTSYGLEIKEGNGDSEKPEFNHVFHFGSMDWEPNVHGVRWLVNEVWPIVIKAIPKAQLVLAGRNMPPEFKSNLTSGISVVGEVADASEFLNRPGIMTIPLHSGSGMRIKAVEGMAAGKPTVSTELGVRGIGVIDGKHVLISDEAEGFASSIIGLLQDSEKAREIAECGKQYVREHFSNNKIIDKLVKFLGQL